MGRKLIIGAAGQIGTDLTLALRAKHGKDNVIATDIKRVKDHVIHDGPFEMLDALDGEGILACVRKYQIKEIYLLSAMLSASGEQAPLMAWDLNMESLLNVLEIAKNEKISKVFWPSSIAVFGNNARKVLCPQNEVQRPETVYGISKSAGEQWCYYYHRKYGLDVRSLRYPGLISYKSVPGGGTTDYAVEIFHKAIFENHYTCYLKNNTVLPMMYMEDAIRGTIELMDAHPKKIRVRTSYNIAGMCFRPYELVDSIKEHIPGFTVSYNPDFRQVIAESWPKSIDDSFAKEEWGWEEKYDLRMMTKEMLVNVSKTAVSNYYINSLEN